MIIETSACYFPARCAEWTSTDSAHVFFFPGIKLFFPLALSEQLIGLCICSFHLCSRCVLASGTSVKVRRGTKQKRERQTWKKGSLISRSPTKNGRSDTGQTERGSVHFERLIKRFWPPLQKRKKRKKDRGEEFCPSHAPCQNSSGEISLHLSHGVWSDQLESIYYCTSTVLRPSLLCNVERLSAGKWAVSCESFICIREGLWRHTGSEEGMRKGGKTKTVNSPQWFIRPLTNRMWSTTRPTCRGSVADLKTSRCTRMWAGFSEWLGASTTTTPVVQSSGSLGFLNIFQ